MKSKIFAFLMLLTAASFAGSAMPKIFIESLDPQPVEPGQDLTLGIRLFNEVAGETTKEFSVKLDVEFPLILKSSTKNMDSVTLCAGCSDTNTYFLSIDPSAISSTYPIQARAISGNSEIKQRIDVKVQGNPDLIFETDSELDKIIPDTIFSITLNITNIGSSRAKQVKISPESGNFVVVGSSVKSFNTIGVRETRLADFNFLGSSKLQADSYEIPMKITYLNDQGKEIIVVHNIGVKVINNGKLNLQSIKISSETGSSTLTAGQPFTVIARIENVGEGKANSISTELSCPFGSKKSFIGQLKEDEDAPAVFDFKTTKSGTFSCDLKVSYEDDTGLKEFSDKVDFTVNPESSSGIFVAGVIILAATFITARRLMKSSN